MQRRGGEWIFRISAPCRRVEEEEEEEAADGGDGCSAATELLRRSGGGRKREKIWGIYYYKEIKNEIEMFERERPIYRATS